MDKANFTIKAKTVGEIYRMAMELLNSGRAKSIDQALVTKNGCTAVVTPA